MKITARTWQQNTRHFTYNAKTAPASETAPVVDTAQGTEETETEIPQEENALFQTSDPNSQNKNSSGSISGSDNGSSSKIKASVPDDNIGQLASELANGHTKLDVLQVSSKAMRVMANLRMSGAVCEGKDKEKINQMIRRVNRLLKRIRTKLRNLEKEEQLERRQEKAEKKKEEQKARALSNELKNRRNKRRKEEQDYARKELTNSCNSSSEAGLPVPGIPGANGGTLPSAASGTGDLSGASISASVPVSADISMAAESISVDITV